MEVNNNKRSRKNYSLLYVIVSIAVVITSAVFVVLLSRQYIIQQAEIRVRDVLLEAKSLHNYVQKGMHPAMYQLKKEARIPQDFYSPEILSSSYISRQIFQQFNESRTENDLPVVEYRLAAKNPRNLINKADSNEACLIDMFNNDRSIKKHSAIIQENGVRYLYYAQPFLQIEQQCLKCHGKKEEAPYELSAYYHWENGFDWIVGDIPAIEIIKTPLVAEFKTSSNIIVAILTTAFVLLILILAISKLRSLNKKKNQEKLQAENTYKTLFNNSGDPILILDLNDKIIKANEAAHKLFEYKEGELTNKTISELFNENSAKKASDKLSQLKQHNKLLYETVFVSTNNKAITCEINATIIPYNGSKAILKSIRDISIRKKQKLELEDHRNNLEQKVKERTEELKNAQAQLIQTEKMVSLGTLTAGISHEINNPLNYIMGSYVGLNNYFADIAVDEDKTLSILLDSLKEGVDRASNIVKGLNQLSRTSSNYNEDCDIHSILDNCLMILHSQLKHRAEVKKNYHANLISIKGNAGNLHQIFINLLTNACQAIATKGQITITSSQNSDNTTIEITDTGEGISKENLSKITDPFFTTKAPGEGTGLGLSICCNLVKEHKGELLFDSELGEGTTVKTTLPNKNHESKN